MARKTTKSKSKSEARKRRPSSVKVPLNLVQGAENFLEGLFCCGVQELEHAAALSSAEEAIALRMSIHKEAPDSAKSGYIIATTVNDGTYRRPESFLRKAGFKKIASFLNHNTERTLTIWGAKALKPKIDYSREECPDCRHDWHGKRKCKVDGDYSDGVKCDCVYLW